MAFYRRRIRRIFPALALVLSFCLVLGWFILLPDEYAELGKHIAGGAGFVSNFQQWSEAGYFDTTSDLKPLLHLWSLGVEEQFYIYWPLILYLDWHLRVRSDWSIFLILIASLLGNLYLVHENRVAAFYSPLSRVWELVVGSHLAYLCITQRALYKSEGHAWLFSVWSSVGASLIFGTVASFDSSFQFPGWWVLLPPLSAYLLVFSGSAALQAFSLDQMQLLVIFGWFFQMPLLPDRRIFSIK